MLLGGFESVSCLLMFFGAVILFFSILKFKKTLALAESFRPERRRIIQLFLKAHIILMVFFLFGYITVGITCMLHWLVISKLFVGIIFLLGAVFVLLAIVIQNLLISEISKYIYRQSKIEKKAALGELAGQIAHELNNPLAIVLGYAQSIAKNIKKDNPLFKHLKNVERETIRCDQLLKKLLALADLEKAEKES